MSYLSMENAEQVMQVLKEAAATLMRPSFGKLRQDQIKAKADQSVVTDVDLAVEKFLTEKLKALFPGATILGEESVEADPANMDLLKQDGAVWVIDPLDGTAPFSTGEDGWGILAAYMVAGEIEAGFVLDGISDQTIIALKNRGVFLNGEKIEAQSIKPLDRQTGMAWFSVIDETIIKTIQQNEHYFQKIIPGCSSSVTLSFLMVEGKVDFLPCTHNQPWDIMPLVLILDELGGRTGKLIDGHRFAGGRLASVQEPSLFVCHASQWQEIKEKLFEGISQERLDQGIRAAH